MGIAEDVAFELPAWRTPVGGVQDEHGFARRFGGIDAGVQIVQPSVRGGPKDLPPGEAHASGGQQHKQPDQFDRLTCRRGLINGPRFTVR